MNNGPQAKQKNEKRQKSKDFLSGWANIKGKKYVPVFRIIFNKV